jgi:hypothetical protein
MSARYSPTRRRLLAGGLLLLLPLAAVATSPPAAEHGSGTGPATALMREMAGTWDVKQQMWPAAGAQPIELPPALAHRRLIDGKFLEETMETAALSRNAFTRMSYFDYNAVSGQYEYFPGFQVCVHPARLSAAVTRSHFTL